MSFSRYNTDDQVISSETVVRGLWSGDSSTLSSTQMFTSSNYTEYYLDVYNNAPESSGSVQFSIQYGNLQGSGSKLINTNVPGYTPSRVVYGEYRNLVYGTEVTNFSFDGSITANQIYVINMARSRYKESLFPGSLVLRLQTPSASVTNSITLVDDSTTTNLTRYIGENRVYYIVSGSSAGVPLASATSSYYGMLFPDLNIIVLNATSGSSTSLLPYLTSSINVSQATSSAASNSLVLYKSLVSGSSISAFNLQSEETVSSTYFFTRVKNSEFNYTTNPSIIDDNGNLLYTTLINNPQTYITSVGMYNDNNELLAVAKLSRPLTKDFTKEALIRIKLDY
jgi:hypothetical protein